MKYPIVYNIAISNEMNNVLNDLIIKYRLPNRTWLFRECIYRGLMAMYNIDVDELERKNKENEL